MSTDAGTLQEARQEVVAAALQLAAWGLVAGASGNVSLRLPSAGTRELLAITPTQRPYDQLTAEDIVIVDFHGESVESQLPPSSETLMHVAAYRARPDVRAVVHSHSLFATVAAVRGCEIPPIIDEVVVTVGGPVKVSRYALPGTQELAEAAVSALEEHKGSCSGTTACSASGVPCRRPWTSHTW